MIWAPWDTVNHRRNIRWLLAEFDEPLLTMRIPSIKWLWYGQFGTNGWKDGAP